MRVKDLGDGKTAHYVTARPGDAADVDLTKVAQRLAQLAADTPKRASIVLALLEVFAKAPAELEIDHASIQPDARQDGVPKGGRYHVGVFFAKRRPRPSR